MKRHWQFKLYLLFLALLYGLTTDAQEIKLSKSIERTFEVTERLNLEISNKYGNVIIDTWSRNEVGLIIEILAFGKDESSAEKLMDRVEFDFKHADDFIEVESVFDRKKSFFKDLINTVGDYSASLLSKHKLQVNYELQIPESTASIIIVNRFGDVHIADLEARLDLTVAHGDIKVNQIRNYAQLNLNYGIAKIKLANEASINLKGAELELDQVQKLDLKSSSSKIRIGTVNNLDIESTNDRIDIEEVRDISGKTDFTEIGIGHLAESCRLNQNYGGVEIKGINTNFSSIRLNGKSTDYQLFFMKNTSFDLSIYARDDKLSLDEFPGQIEKRYMDEKTKFVEVKGHSGKNSEDRKLNIDAQNGAVNIGFNQELPETYNK
jgi:hypothetical protein